MKYKTYLFYIIGLLSLTPFVNAFIALLLGVVTGYYFEGYYEQKKNDRYSKQLLKITIVGLGFTLTLTDVIKVSSQSISITVLSILSIFLVGYWLSKFFKLSPKMCFLIASGTAICGGSAIAAVAPVIRAKNQDISKSLIAIFLLNTVALFVFPILGKLFRMSDFQFGLWSAIAIHDTSSVAGASSSFSDVAFQIATITKLARTLWIIPLVFIAGYYFKSKESKVSIPTFIILFVIATIVSTYFFNEEIKKHIKYFSKETLDLALFFIGTSLKPNKFKDFFSKPFLLAFILWLFISVFTFTLIRLMY
jgi:uncharacterized integral membrane protein (TIGR00698 family)